MEGKSLSEVLTGFQQKVSLLRNYVLQNQLDAVEGSVGRKLTTKDLRQAASAVSTETTKFTLGFSSSLEGAKQISQLLHGALTELTAAVLIVTNEKEYCDSLKSQIRNSTIGVIESISDLLSRFQESQRSPNETVSPHLTGVIWKYCKEFEQLKLSNSAALLKELNESLPLVRDATHEMEELAKADAKEFDADEDVEDFFDDDGVSEEVNALIPSIVILLKGAYNAIKKTSDCLSLRDQQEETTLPSLEAQWFNEVSSLAQMIFSHVDQLGASMYENDIKVIVSHASNLSTVEKSFLAHLKKAGETFPEISVPFLNLLEEKLEEAIKTLKEVSGVGVLPK